MSEGITANLRVCCRDCGKPMEIIQQEELDNRSFSLVTCWQPTCLLCGFTLSVDRYKKLNQTQLEAYREMNRISQLKYVRVDSY
jgi:hypothetical protein